MPFTPLDILFIVLAFCALWLTAALFWLVWQVGSILRNVNDTLDTVKEKISLIESAVTAVRHRFERMTSLAGPLFDASRRMFDYAMEKREEKRERRVQEREEPPKRRVVRRSRLSLNEDEDTV